MSNTITKVCQKGAKAEDKGGGPMGSRSTTLVSGDLD